MLSSFNDLYFSNANFLIKKYAIYVSLANIKTCKWFIFSTSVFCSCKLFVNVQMWFLVFFVHVFQFHKFWNDHINDPNRPSLSFTSIPLSVHPNQTNQTRTAINFNDKCIKWMPLKRKCNLWSLRPTIC